MTVRSGGGEPVEVVDLAPFPLIPLLGRLRDAPVVLVWALLVPLFLTVAGISAAEGALGDAGDVQVWRDVQRILGVHTAVSSPPRFPFLRDAPSWFLLVVVVTTYVLLLRQWRAIEGLLSGLARSGALTRPPEAGLSRRARWLGVGRLVGDCPADQRLARAASRINDLFRAAAGRHAVIVAGLLVALSVWLVLGARQRSTFRVLAPPELEGAALDRWLDATYDSWWASTAHPWGLGAYCFIAFAVIYLILLENVVGLLVTYGALILPEVAGIDADWLDRDGEFGWRPSVEVYRTVYLSLVLHSVTLSLLLVILGLESFPPLILLVALYVVGVPLYLLFPWSALGSAIEAAKTRQIARIERAADRAGVTYDDVERIGPYIAEIQRVRGARIRPLRLPGYQVPTFVAVVLLPVCLTVAQILFSLRFGA